MCAINLKSERGALLVTVIVFIVFVSVLGLVVGTLTTSENKMQLVQGEEQKALYAAQSGLEYGIKQVLSADSLSDWTEDNITVNDQTTVKVQVEQTDPTTVVVRAWGKSHRYVKELETTLANMDTSDVSKFAIYAAGSATGAVTRDSLAGDHRQGLIYQHAKVMPQFNLDELRAAAQESGTYYDGDLVVNNSFSPPENAIVFVEGKTRFVKGNWSGNVHFVSEGDVIFNPSWKNSAPVHMTIYQPEADAQVYIQPDQSEDGGDDNEDDHHDDEGEDDHGVDFEIENDNVIPSESFAAKATVLGAAISASGYYDLPVTVKLSVANDDYEPFGAFNLAVSGNVNDNHNPRNYIFPDIYPGGSPIKIEARSWDKKSWWYDGNDDSDWQALMTVNTENSSPNVITLRDGDPVPNIQGFMNQSSLQDFVAPYIDSETNQISLKDNQAIYLFELGTTNLDSPAADFQDLVVLVTLAKDQEQLSQSNDDEGGGSGNNGTDLVFYGGIITNGSVNGQFASESSGDHEDDDHEDHGDEDHGGDDDHGGDEDHGGNEDHGGDEDHGDEHGQGSEVKQLVVVHDRGILRDFLKYSINGGPRVLQAAVWKSIN